MVKGKNVVKGRHRLPPTTLCPSCNAGKWPDESDFMWCMRGKVKLPPLHPAPPRLLELYRVKAFRRHIRAYNQAFAFTSIGASATGKRFRDVIKTKMSPETMVYTPIEFRVLWSITWGQCCLMSTGGRENGPRPSSLKSTSSIRTCNSALGIVRVSLPTSTGSHCSTSNQCCRRPTHLRSGFSALVKNSERTRRMAFRCKT
jgi:hypothetical protein